MNATQEFAAQQKIDVPKTFIIAGASKVRHSNSMKIIHKFYLIAWLGKSV